MNVEGLTGDLGQLLPINGGTLTLAGAFTNNLPLILTNGGVLTLNGNNGSKINAGRIDDATNATVNLGGTLATVGSTLGLGVFNRYGRTIALDGFAGQYQHDSGNNVGTHYLVPGC